MVLVFSKNANDSPQIRKEVERAVNKGVIVVPLRIEDVVPTESLEYFMSNVHWLDALTPPLAQHLDHLAGTVKAILDRTLIRGRAKAPCSSCLRCKPCRDNSRRLRAEIREFVIAENFHEAARVVTSNFRWRCVADCFIDCRILRLEIYSASAVCGRSKARGEFG